MRAKRQSFLLPPPVPAAVQEVVRQALDRVRERRFANGADLGRALRTALEVGTG